MRNFKFDYSMNRPFNPKSYIKSITFPLFRYGRKNKTLTFPNPVDELTAIKEVEAYLSKPLDQKDFDFVKYELRNEFLFTPKSLNELKNVLFGENTNRGDILTSWRFVQSICPLSKSPHEVEIILES